MDIVTANAMPGDREACLAAGMDDYLSKPLSLAKLRAALEHSRPVSASDMAAAHSDQAETPVIDLGVLRELRQIQSDDQAALGRLVEEFLAHAGGCLAHLRQAAAQYGPLTEGREAAHALKGSSLAIGAPRLAHAADLAETLARLGETRGFAQQVDQVAAELEKANGALLQYVKRAS